GGWFGGVHQRVEYYSTTWYRKNAWGMAHIHGQPNTITVLYEDIFQSDNGHETLQNIAAWTQLPFKHQLPDDVLTNRVNQSNKAIDLPWDAKADAIVETLCGDLWREIQESV
ncbi:MAG: hypothetical protein AAF125_19655, partial [Chloroflexota bacterium]